MSDKSFGSPEVHKATVRSWLYEIMAQLERSVDVDASRNIPSVDSVVITVNFLEE